MSIWLWKRLGALFGLCVLLGGAGYLRAQNDYPAPAKTPEEAAEMFYRLLRVGEEAREARYEIAPDESQSARDAGAISRQQVQSLGVDPQEFARSLSEPYRRLPNDQSLLRLFQRLRGQITLPRYETSSAQKVDGQIRVTIDSQPKISKRELVILEEDGGYRVDLFATYGLWNNLSGLSLDKAIFDLTGAVSPALEASPTFVGVLDQRRKANCQSNLKQISLGIAQYVQDYDERFPRAREWQPILQPYLKSEALYHCPSSPTKKQGYAMNQWLSQSGLWNIAEPARVIALYETSNLKPNVFGPGTGRAYRHDGGSNLAFADGHVKWFAKGKEDGVLWKP